MNDHVRLVVGQFIPGRDGDSMSKKIRKDEFKVDLEGDTVCVWNKEEDNCAIAHTGDLTLEDLTEFQIEKLVLKAKSELLSERKKNETLKSVHLESVAYKAANPRKNK